MDAQDFVINDGSECQVVKNLCAVAPNVYAAVFLKALIVKSVDLCNLPTFMVSSDQCYAFWVAYFKSEEEEEGLD